MHTNPPKWNTTIVGMNNPLDNIEPEQNERIQEFAAFEAGPAEFVQWRAFTVPKYGIVLGIAAPSTVKPYLTFNTCGSHGASMFMEKIM